MNVRKKNIVLLLTIISVLVFAVSALAAGPEDVSANDDAEVETESHDIGFKSIAAGIAIGIAAGGGAIGMGLATSKSVEGIARQTEAESKIRTTLMLGLVFIETAIIYALLVVILIIFVL